MPFHSRLRVNDDCSGAFGAVPLRRGTFPFGFSAARYTTDRAACAYSVVKRIQPDLVSVCVCPFVLLIWVRFLMCVRVSVCLQ